MNTYNHHRVITEFSNRIRHEAKIKNDIITDDEIQIFKDASDYTDVMVSKKDYFFYHFYYDIVVETNNGISSGTIILNRITKENYQYEKSMAKCDFDNTVITSPKLFFTTINDFSTVGNDDRAKYLQPDNPADRSNQSDSVAFLHAMGAEGEHPRVSENVFIAHITNCLLEFIFLKDKKEAFFMLGIALHGIMDSFTPSHTGFKQYSLQEMSLHAQGDVMPFKTREYNSCITNGQIDSTIPEDLKKYFIGDEGYIETCDKVNFEPGQVTDDFRTDSKTLVAAIIKRYNNDDNLNIIENEMLKIFIESYLDKENDEDLKSIYNNTKDLSKINFDYNSLMSDGVPLYEHMSLSRLNEILNKKKFRDDAFDYSEAAINVVRNVYVRFLSERQKCINNYDYYKNIKPKIKTIFTDDCEWRKNYDIISKNYKGSKFSLYQMRDIQGMITINDVKKHSGIVWDTIKGTINEIASSQNHLIHENQQINSNFNLYGSNNKV